MATPSTPPGIAVLGAGIFAKEAHLPSLAALPSESYSFRAVYSRSSSSANSLASTASSLLKLPTSGPEALRIYYDVDTSSPNTAEKDALGELLASPDIAAVIVVLPITLQPSIILRALAAGKHVLSEKPVAPSVAEGLDLIKEYEEKYKSKGLVWRVAENFEAEPGYQITKALLLKGEIGEVRSWRLTSVGYVDEASKWYKTPWRTVPDYQGGFLLDGGVHSAALLRLVLPTRMTHLTAYASLSKSYLAPHDAIYAVVKNAPVPTESAVQDPKTTPTPFAHGVLELAFSAPTASRSSPQNGNGTIFTGAAGFITLSRGKFADGSGKLSVEVTKVVKSKGPDGEDKETESVTTYEEKERGVEVEIGAFLRAISPVSRSVISNESLAYKGGSGAYLDHIGEPRGALQDVAIIQAGLTSAGKEVDLVGLVGET